MRTNKAVNFCNGEVAAEEVVVVVVVEERVVLEDLSLEFELGFFALVILSGLTLLFRIVAMWTGEEKILLNMMFLLTGYNR